VRAIHGGIAGVFFVMIPAAIAGNEDLRDAILHRNWNELKYLGYWFAIGLFFLMIALLVRRANLVVLGIFALMDLVMLLMSWYGVKSIILVPILAVSLLGLLTEMYKLVVTEKSQVA
jgi:hypothetical protein